MRPHALSALLACLCSAAPAFATCQGESLFACRIGKKVLGVCRSESAVSYRFGPAGKPELQITTTLQDLAYQPWPGVSRSIWEAATFQNAGTSYEAWSSFDRHDPQAVVEGGVNVLKGETQIASLACNKGSVESALDLLFDAKYSVGQCWSPEKHRWSAAPCD